MKKKILALLLCLATLCTVLYGCGPAMDDVGETVPVYFNTQVVNFDPARAYTDDAAWQIVSLLFSGLTKLDANGKVKPDMAKEWEYEADASKNSYVLEFTLEETQWSDGRQVSADDFVFAWKRIMNPDFQSEGAALLYDLKNAKAVKLGDMSIDDLGVTAVDKTILRVEFSHDINLDAFLEICASPLLVPLREDKVSRDDDWASNTALLVTNGPFTVRSNRYSYETGAEKTLILERNLYYFRDKDKDPIQESVIPYRLAIHFNASAEDHLAAFNAGTEAFNSYLPLSERANYASKVEKTDTMITHTYFFNTTRAPFDNADVRRALSLAIDRNEIVNRVVFAKAASGFVNSSVYESKRGTSFREVGGEVISASANMQEAQALIRAAGITEKSFTVTIRPNEVDRAVAEYCKSVWEQLGFDVTIKETRITSSLSVLEYELLIDEYTTLYRSGDFDVIAVDWTATSVYPFGTLAPFSLNFSGGAIDMTSENFEQVPHITGYNSEAYNAVIDRAFNENDYAAKATILHEAEAMLAKDMPVMPIFEYQNAYMISGDLKSVKEAFGGYLNFTKAKLKNAEQYAQTTQEQ